MTTFEEACVSAERAAHGLEAAANSLLKTAKGLRKAAAEGSIASYRKFADSTALAEQAVRQEAVNARSAWPFTPELEEVYLRDSYEAELIEAAQSAGMKIRKRDTVLVASPSLIKIRPSEKVAMIDKKRVTSLRPSKLVQILLVSQTKKPALSSERFLEMLYKMYRILQGSEKQSYVQALASIHAAITMLPVASSEYGTLDFSRDLFLLDRSGLRQTRSGASFSLPASTATRGGKGVFQFVAPDGEVTSYFGIQFVESTR